MSAPEQKDINRIISGYNQADSAADYADTLVVEMQQMSGDEYRMVWSNRYSGDFVPDAERRD